MQSFLQPSSLFFSNFSSASTNPNNKSRYSSKQRAGWVWVCSGSGIEWRVWALPNSPLCLCIGQPKLENILTKKSAASGTKGAQLQKLIDATLGSGNLREAVRIPPREDINKWLAVNTVDFFNQVNILYDTLTEFCTPANCPTLNAGPKYEYRWAWSYCEV